MIIRSEDVPQVESEHNPLVMKKVINRDEHSEAISVTWVKIWGYHKKMRCDAADRVYYIIEGDGEFQVGDDPSGKVTGGDYVFIPRGVPYVFEGHMTYLVMNGPAFAPDFDIRLE
jgi:mannose-6-phosphate isomerase-like protein (cupin superfamily)